LVDCYFIECTGVEDQNMSDPEDPSTEEEPIATADMEEEEETGPSACS